MPSPKTERARELRKQLTITERRLWVSLKGRQLGGWKFRRQHPIGVYVVDFVCLAARLVVELDGSSHDHEARCEYGQRRQAWLESQGFKVLRFRSDYPEQNYLDGVWDAIEFALSELPTQAAPPRLRRTSPASGEENAEPG